MNLGWTSISTSVLVVVPPPTYVHPMFGRFSSTYAKIRNVGELSQPKLDAKVYRMDL
jgi:hypothetical protein